MTKERLKTLKDIIGIWEMEYVIIRDLKNEAIKHIKSGKMVEGAKFWAMEFFNISEEDLNGR